MASSIDCMLVVWAQKKRPRLGSGERVRWEEGTVGLSASVYRGRNVSCGVIGPSSTGYMKVGS
jgi:hypothetical protein